MEKNQYGLAVKFQKLGYADVHPIVAELHDVKSIAGKLFHNDEVISTCVYDADGVARLYLKKTPMGVVREER